VIRDLQLVKQTLNVMALAKSKLAVGLLIGLGAVALFLHLGIRSHHHWDEFVYLYGAQHYSAAALTSGQFEASNIIGFYNSRIGHVLLLQLLSNLFGDGLRGITSIQAVFTGMVIGTSIMLVLLSLMLWRDFCGALAFGILSLLAPVSVYLGPKLLTEVPSTFGAVASLLLLVAGLRVQRRALLLPLLLTSAIALTGGVLARIFVLPSVVGAWLALVVVCPPGMSRRQILRAVAVVSGLSMVAVLVSYRLLGVDLMRFIPQLSAVSSIRIPILKRAEQVSFAFGLLLLLAPLAVVSNRRQELYFYGLWACCSILPVLLAFRYIEIRFLVGGAPAVAGLAMLGGEVVWYRLGAPTQPAVRLGCIGLVGLLLARTNSHIQPKTQYEVNSSAYAKVMNRISNEYPGHPIMVAWTYSDYHYLRVAYPEAPVYTANTWVHAIGPGGYAENTESWIAAQKRWYGDHYISNLSALEKLSPSPWLFVNWKPHSWKTNHFSWMWGHPCLRMTQLFDYGKYEVYRVDKTGSQSDTCPNMINHAQIP
jgi:hypothetical protein